MKVLCAFESGALKAQDLEKEAHKQRYTWITKSKGHFLKRNQRLHAPTDLPHKAKMQNKITEHPDLEETHKNH